MPNCDDIQAIPLPTMAYGMELSGYLRVAGLAAGKGVRYSPDDNCFAYKNASMRNHHVYKDVRLQLMTSDASKGGYRSHMHCTWKGVGATSCCIASYISFLIACYVLQVPFHNQQ